MKNGLGAVAVIATLLLTPSCGNNAEPGSPPRGGSADYQVYESVASLIRETDATVVVEVAGVASKEYDDGGDDADERGFPMAFWDAEVIDVLEPGSGIERGDTVVIGWPDLDEIEMEDRSALNAGESVVVFAVRRTPVDAPGIDTQEVFFMPLGGDNGVMDVAQGQATARSDLLTRLSDPPAGGSEADRLSVSLADLERAVTDQHQKDG
jgi:hypothetical protein